MNLPLALGRLLAGALALVCVLSTTAHALRLSTVAGRGVGDRKPATNAGLLEPTGIAFKGGNTLIADSRHARIRLVKPNGKIITLVGTFPGTFGDDFPRTATGLKVPLKVRVAPNGDLLIAEFGSHRVRRIAGGDVSTIAGQADQPGFSGDDGDPLAAQLNGPADAFMDAAGDVWIADFNNHRIRKIDDATGEITTVAGTGTPGYSGNGGDATQAMLNNPVCVVPGPGGIYICDAGNHMIRRLNPNGTIVRVVGNGKAGFRDFANAKKGKLDFPTDIAFDAQGNGIIADSRNQRVRKWDRGTTPASLTTIAGDGSEGYTGDDVPAASPLGDPTAVGVDALGGILIAEASNNRVRRLSGGQLTSYAGDGVATFGGDGGFPRQATFSGIHGVGADAAGNILVADNGNNRLRRVNVATNTVSTIAGNGSPTYGGEDVDALDAGLTISDVVVDALGRIVFSDTQNHRVRRVNLDGRITTIAGTGSAGFSGDDGPATGAQLDAPTGLNLDAAGNLYIADFLNNRIRRVDAVTQEIETLAGDGGAGFDGDGQLATNAQLNNPTDSAVDGDGNLLIADYRNHRVRRVDAATQMIGTFAGTGDPGDNGDGPDTPTALRLRGPSDVKVLADGVVLIVDSDNHKVRRVHPTEGITTIAGSGLPGHLDKGQATNGRMSLPLRLHPMPDGRILVADNMSFVVRALVP